MTTSIIIIICVLLLLAYAFDVTAAKTKIPSIILLLVLGYGMKQASIALNISVPDLSPILPILGTVGLILIVLEGSLELELNKKQHLQNIRQSILQFDTQISRCIVTRCNIQFMTNIR